MSGGSYDYLGFKIDEAAGQVAVRRDTPLRRAFAAHLRLVGKAMYDVEWVDSCDSSPGDEDEAIRACLAPGAELDAASAKLEEAIAEAREVLAFTVVAREKVR